MSGIRKAIQVIASLHALLIGQSLTVFGNWLPGNQVA